MHWPIIFRFFSVVILTHRPLYQPIYQELFEPIYEDEYETVYDYFVKCTDGSMTSCKPVAVVSFESLSNPATGKDEMTKIANSMIGKSGVNMIAPDAWQCLYDETMVKSGEFENHGMAYRDARSPSKAGKTYTAADIQLMEDELNYVKNKYSQVPWDTDPIAQQLVGYVNSYLADMPSPGADPDVGEPGAAAAGATASGPDLSGEDIPPETFY